MLNGNRERTIHSTCQGKEKRKSWCTPKSSPKEACQLPAGKRSPEGKEWDKTSPCTKGEDGSRKGTGTCLLGPEKEENNNQAVAERPGEKS